MGDMATSNLPTPQLQPVPDEKNLLVSAEESACGCGGCSCGAN